jgi:hypothetical protein
MNDIERLRLLTWRHHDPSSVRARRGELLIPRGWPPGVDGPALVTAYVRARAACPTVPAWDFVRGYLSGEHSGDDD